MPISHKVVIMVAYLDKGASPWQLEYDNGKDKTALAGRVNPTKTGKIRTAVFPIGDIVFRGAQAGGMDFRIRATGKEDAVIQCVRLLRMAGNPGIEQVGERDRERSIEQ